MFNPRSNLNIFSNLTLQTTSVRAVPLLVYNLIRYIKINTILASLYINGRINLLTVLLGVTIVLSQHKQQQEYPNFSKLLFDFFRCEFCFPFWLDVLIPTLLGSTSNMIIHFQTYLSSVQ